MNDTDKIIAAIITHGRLAGKDLDHHEWLDEFKQWIGLLKVSDLAEKTESEAMAATIRKHVEEQR